jgi:hypothetical protein
MSNKSAVDGWLMGADVELRPGGPERCRIDGTARAPLPVSLGSLSGARETGSTPRPCESQNEQVLSTMLRRL